MSEFNQWLTNLPLDWATPITMSLFVVLLVLLWSFSSDTIFGDAPDTRRWRDIRIWGSVLIFVQLSIYALFQPG